MATKITFKRNGQVEARSTDGFGRGVVGDWAEPDPSGRNMKRLWKFMSYDGVTTLGPTRASLRDAVLCAARREGLAA